MAQNKRKKEVHTRFTEEEYARVQVQAKAAGKSIGAFVRERSLDEKSVHITDGKEIANKLGNLHNQMIVYHGDMVGRLEELRDSVRAYATMASQFGTGVPCSPAVHEAARMLNIRVEAAVDMLYRAYGEYELQTEEKMQHIIQPMQCGRSA